MIRLKNPLPKFRSVDGINICVQYEKKKTRIDCGIKPAKWRLQFCKCLQTNKQTKQSNGTKSTDNKFGEKRNMLNFGRSYHLCSSSLPFANQASRFVWLCYLYHILNCVVSLHYIILKTNKFKYKHCPKLGCDNFKWGIRHSSFGIIIIMRLRCECVC